MNATNIASYLSGMAQKQPQAIAVAIQRGNDNYRQYSYSRLDEYSNVLSRGLQENGIKKGTRTILMVKPGLEFFALVFALFKIGAVLVAVDPGIGIKKLGRCLAEAEAEVFIGSRKAHFARMLFSWAAKTLKTNIMIASTFLPAAWLKSLPQVIRAGSNSGRAAVNETQPDETAAILFTSGSTGTPKGVVYTHANFIAQVHALQRLYDIQAGEIDLATFPLFALYAPVLGMTAVLPDMDYTRPGSVDPARIIAAVNHFNATTMFGSPALLNRVGRWGVAKQKSLPSLKRVLSAGAPVSPAVLECFSKLLDPAVEIFTPYGATESLPVSSIGSNEILRDTAGMTAQGKGICVGKPVNGMRVFIIHITDGPIPVWHDELILATQAIGEIVVQGPQVTGRYYNRPEADALAKIKDSQGTVYHRMGDVGYIDEQGRTWFCGRKSHRVVTQDGTLFSICCEGIFNVHANVFRTALVALKNHGVIKPGLCVELETDAKSMDKEIIRRELLDIGARFEQTHEIKEIFFHPGFPVDIRHNAKIDREQLAQWAEKQSA